ncbi:hypothetical protein GA0061078_0154 [Bifidobacterium bohemicum]|uniref:Membrane associated protein n=1 Tax=Bifidobacterium bohemicum DSM 22767 TaxID=1437606 RepID=A0A086ZG46_9BIFI|nr:hypothetical protein [Bifidobacterium bohemicum]KFI45496.1 hypothetical protein BBOH_1095 [Bifidobacterium bohemicum DSM 22767]SCB71835.1 hypothetical protein GA0061078_0154 [Bifidobacterium bohemicum]
MTSLKDTQDADDDSDDAQKSGLSDPSKADAWDRFAKEHADDLEGIENSRNAKKFERHVRRQEKKALMSVEDLSPDSFVAENGRRHAFGTRGPRDFERSSWLDADTTIDDIDDFTPPNPDLGLINVVTAVFIAMLAAGIALVIIAAFLPKLAGVLGLLGGLGIVIGSVGLITRHHDITGQHPGWFDDGSRV